MPNVRLQLDMKREAKSYIDSLYAILTATGLFGGPKYRLSGLTGMAFKFTVHERLLPLSVSAYGEWINEHRPGIDNLGIYTVLDAGRTRHPTFRHYQQDAVLWVKESLNRGVGVIYWIPEFGIIDGYDEEDRVFFVQDGWSGESQIVLYDNLGLNFTEFWYCQAFGGKVDIPLEAMILESLRLAIYDWDTPHKTLPNTDIGSGRLAYDFLIRALKQGDYDEGGAVYILDSYCYSREEICAYLQEARAVYPELGEASRLYEELIGILPLIRDGIIETSGARKVDRNQVELLTEQFAAAQQLEDRTVDVFRSLSERYPDPRRSIIPRWGIHTPK
ncbi:hypothetical protein PALU110988_06770 [Paenibacillus lupini]|uniref:hypothetical protein n=1 Tax=Paenibacillus lupini TaxID=1450204 RepID=UPI0014220F73|nr:hypothetical protein [Paenibacillus lupini]NIK23290.1 hypothetical protein [Paenibacillus lupini]